MPSAVLPVFVAYVSPTPPTDELRQTTVVDRSGTVFGFLAHAVHGDITFELNRWGSGTVTLTADDPDTAYAIGGQLREIQLCRGDQILLWGPITDAQVQHNQVTLTVSDPLWYLTRTYIGGPGRPLERLTNPSFSSGLSGWRTRKIASFSGVEPVFTGTTSSEVTTVTSPSKDGRAAKITATVAHAIFGAIGGTGEIFLDQEFTVVGGTRGVQVTFSAWARVNSSGFGSVNDEGVQSALQLRVYPVGYTQDVAQLVDHTETQFDVKHAVDVFVKHEQSISVPSGQTYRVQARLASLSGTVEWDACSVRYDDALYWFQADQGTIVSDLVAHAQDSAFGRTTFNLACPAVTTGGLRDLVLLEADMQDIFGAIEQLFEPSDGVDISVDYTSTTRTVSVSSPTRGARRPECELRLGRNVTSYTYNPGPQSAANTVRIGATGSASTASPFASGIILEDVAPAPPDISADLHNLVAARRLAEVLLPDTVQATTTVRGQAVTGTGGQLLGVLQCGDVVPVTITQGAIDLQADYRVTKLVIHGDDTMTLSLDRATFGQRIKRIPLDHLVDRKIEDIVKRLTTVERSLNRPGSTSSDSLPTATTTIPTSTLTIAGLLPAGGSTGQVATKVTGADYDVDWETPTAGGAIDLQVFSTAGSISWTKPAGATWVAIIVIGAGAGGGSGRRTSTIGSGVAGGGGGGPGGVSYMLLPAAGLSSSESGYVGIGGTGGTAISANDTVGNVGTAGETSWFGNNSTYPVIFATGGFAGGTASQGGIGGVGTVFTAPNYQASSGAAAGVGGGIAPEPTADAFSAGGSAGGGITSSGHVMSGGRSIIPRARGGLFTVTPVAGSGGAAPSGHVGPAGNGADGLAPYLGALMTGSGGAGGASDASAAIDTLDGSGGNAGHGGKGVAGSGGGGGGANTNTAGKTSGAGGNGGDGVIAVASW